MSRFLPNDIKGAMNLAEVLESEVDAMLRTQHALKVADRHAEKL